MQYSELIAFTAKLIPNTYVHCVDKRRLFDGKLGGQYSGHWALEG